MSGRKARIPEGVFDTCIQDLTRDGYGVVEVDRNRVLIDGALPGEEVRFRYLRRRGRRLWGAVEELSKASRYRSVPPCAYFGRCGGCSFQHLAAGRQLTLKEDWLLQDLAAIGGVEPELVLPPLTGPTLGYRRKARLGVRYVPGKGRVLIGFRERGGSYITDMHCCPVLEPQLSSLLDPLSELVGSLSIKAHIPQIDVAAGERGTALCVRVLEQPAAEDRVRLRGFAKEWRLRLELQPGGRESIVPVFEGSGMPRYSIGEHGQELFFGTQEFAQVNRHVNLLMVRQALDLLALDRDCQVLDLFCGIGNFTLPIAAQAKFVTGVESQPQAIARARENAHRNGLRNVSFHVDDLDKDPAGAAWSITRYQRALLDPARSGAAGALAMLADNDVSRLVYVSCNPTTLARDARTLVHEHGFGLVGAGIVDMFPHTAHVESMAVFER